METVAVLFGGRSTEHDVSVITALASVITPLELTKKYQVVPVYIAKNGAWYSDESFKDIQLFTSGDIDDVVAKLTPVTLQLDGGMNLIKFKGFGGRKIAQRIDMVFPAMHGTYGEDGDLMGLLEMAGVAYVGCGVAAAAIAMDKVLAKQLAEVNGIPVSKYVYFSKHDYENDTSKFITMIEEKLHYPLFIKPAHLGSSIGISRVVNAKELKNGLEVAAYYDDKILVEEAVNHLKEVTLPIIGNDKPEPALLESPLSNAKDFFDFDKKYMHGGKKGKTANQETKGAQGYSEIPAVLPEKLYDRAIDVGLQVYRSLGCRGISRIDMLIDTESHKVYFNEVNPLPGSLYSHNWNKAGISNIELVEKLLRFAKEEYQKKQDMNTSFKTNYLKQF